MRFLHISDIHFRSPDCLTPTTDPDWHYRNALVNELARRCGEEGALDGILVGGDIAFKGAKDEFDTALAWLKRLADACGCELERVFVIPGNHDIDRKRITGSTSVQNVQQAILRAPDLRRERVFRQQWTDEHTGKFLVEPLTQYNEFAKIFSCQVYAPEHLSWRQDIDLQGGVKLRIHGLTSPLFCAAGEPDGVEDTKGCLYLSPLQTVLETGPDIVNLILCHHPPDWFLDGDDVEDAVNGRACVQVYGHTHKRRHHKDDGYAIFRAPAVTPPKTEHGWEPGYSILELNVIAEGSERKLRIEADILRWQSNPDMYVPVQMSRDLARFVHEIPLPSTIKRTSSVAPSGLTTTQSQQALTRQESANEVEATMGSRSTRNLVIRFWKLPSSARRDITLALKLIDRSEIADPEPERYGRALLRAGERSQLNELDKAISEREGA